MVAGAIRDQRHPFEHVQDGARCAREAGRGRGFALAAVAVHNVTDHGIVVESEFDHLDFILPVAESCHQSVGQKMTLHRAEPRRRFLLATAIIRSGDFVGPRQRVGPTVEVDRRRQRAPVADAIRGPTALGDVITHRDPVVGVGGRGVVGAAGESQPRICPRVELLRL